MEIFFLYSQSFSWLVLLEVTNLNHRLSFNKPSSYLLDYIFVANNYNSSRSIQCAPKVFLLECINGSQVSKVHCNHLYSSSSPFSVSFQSKRERIGYPYVICCIIQSPTNIFIFWNLFYLKKILTFPPPFSWV